MSIKTPRKSGFTLVEIMIVVAIIGLLAAIAIPNFIKARSTSQVNACINNLCQIEGAEQQWGLETKQAAAAVPTYNDVSSYMRNSVICPAGGAAATFGGSYTLVNVGGPDKPQCKIVPGPGVGAHILPPDTAN